MVEGIVRVQIFIFLHLMRDIAKNMKMKTLKMP